MHEISNSLSTVTFALMTTLYPFVTLSLVTSGCLYVCYLASIFHSSLIYSIDSFTPSQQRSYISLLILSYFIICC